MTLIPSLKQLTDWANKFDEFKNLTHNQLALLEQVSTGQILINEKWGRRSGKTVVLQLLVSYFLEHGDGISILFGGHSWDTLLDFIEKLKCIMQDSKHHIVNNSFYTFEYGPNRIRFCIDGSISFDDRYPIIMVDELHFCSPEWNDMIRLNTTWYSKQIIAISSYPHPLPVYDEYVCGET